MQTQSINPFKNHHAVWMALTIMVMSVMLAVGPAVQPVSAAPQSKAKTKASPRKKPRPKASAKPVASRKAVHDEKIQEAKLKKANAILKSLSSSKKSALTKLLKSGKKEELEALPGVGEVTAEAIIKARPLKSTAHLILVSGIGEKTFKQIVDSRK